MFLFVQRSLLVLVCILFPSRGVGQQQANPCANVNKNAVPNGQYLIYFIFSSSVCVMPWSVYIIAFCSLCQSRIELVLEKCTIDIVLF